MAATTISLHFQPLSSHSRAPSHSSIMNSHVPIAGVLLRRRRAIASLFLPKDSRKSIHQACAWGANPRSGTVMGNYGDDIDGDEDEEEEEEDRSLDLLIRFVENVFKKVSRKARKAVKSVLPVPISTKLVGFAVNGTIILTFLWVLKAFLELITTKGKMKVICTLGSVVFASILLIRGIWTGISYFQESRGYRADDDEPQSWSRIQPAI